MAYQERAGNSSVLAGLRDDLSENQKATENVMKAIEAGIITVTTKGRLMELEAEASRIRDAICLEEASLTHIERDFIVYWMEQFRGGNVESAEFRRKVIDSFVNAVYLWDDHIRIAFNYSGKGSAVDMDIIMETEAESFAGPGCSCNAPGTPPWRGRQVTPYPAPSKEGALPLYRILATAWSLSIQSVLHCHKRVVRTKEGQEVNILLTAECIVLLAPLSVCG